MQRKWSIEVHSSELSILYTLRMSDKYDLFFFRIMEHESIIYKNTSIQVGVFFLVAYLGKYRAKRVKEKKESNYNPKTGTTEIPRRR